MHLGACSVGNWQLIEVSVWESLVIEEALTCGFLSYHPRVVGLTLTSCSIENICSTVWFDNNSLPDSFRCSPCLVNKSLLLTFSIILIWQKIFASLSKLLLKEFYMHGSMHRESNLITVQQDVTYSVYYIYGGSSTCFGC